MPTFNNNPQLIRLIIVLLIAGSGLIRWVVVKLQEQAAKKRAMDAYARRGDEMLRTGREPEAGPAVMSEQAQRESQAAARRQEQIEEFRRRQQERARQRAEAQRASTPGAPPVRIPVPASVSVPGPGPVLAPPIRAAPRPAPRPAPVVQAQKKAARAPLGPPPPPTEEPEATHRLVNAMAQQKPVAVAARAALVAPRTPEQWRRAIVMNTILSPAPGSGEGGDPWSPVG